ncbi:hypothetical protein A2U01_0060597, partial [Trifolium medium]|nr:hypothetical protein [Trifolium medium]
WLATDTSPYELTAIRNDCQYNLGQARPELKIVDAVRSEFGTGPESDFSILHSTVG